jgi:hypothetical protein
VGITGPPGDGISFSSKNKKKRFFSCVCEPDVYFILLAFLFAL